MKNKIFSLLFFFAQTTIFAKTINILTYFDLKDFPITFDGLEEKNYHLKTFLFDINGCLQTAYKSDTEKVFVMGEISTHPSNISLLPADKRILFVWEPRELHPSYYNLFNTVYTYNDNLIDNKKYFKIYYPCLLPMRENLPTFNERKFCTMVASNWTRERIKILNFFDTKPTGEFQYYGNLPGPTTKNYLSAIPGMWRSEEKLTTLSKYLFCICFENTDYINGYITEKIFCCFASGTVPIYLGAPNITHYIPKNLTRS